ncbi:radical SAM protein [Niameybacter massiliensis]|uniref:Radical SAM protein n=1 Tax=Holtiella tumoricola TaxID=3018743 RepID=A0AA42DJQ1_9FIRM|nr:radical SAM protein [Holtiella tumoricola]MDA3730214.1 radical SAM protein [Holtiella tumoricola]
MELKSLIKIIPMLFSKGAVENFFYLHRRFKENSNYKLKYLINCSLNVIKNERIVKHDGEYIVNAFLPPVNSKAFKCIAQNVPGEGAEFYTNHVKGVRLAPISTYVAVTKRCMYNCWHCSASEMMGQPQCDLSTKEMIQIVQALQRLGVGIIGFTGGEPLVRQDLEEIIQAIDKRSMTLMFSNGYGLTKERAESLKKAGLFGVAISFDSTKAQEHDAKRGYEGAHKIALDAIRHAKDAGLYTMGQVVCTREMLQSGEIHEVAKFLKKEGIHELRIVEPIPCGNLEEQQDEVLIKEEKEALIQLHVCFNNNPDYPKTSVFPYVESEEQYGCGAGVQHSYIDYKGNFRACDFIYESYGNVLKEPIEEIWQRMHQACGKPKCDCYAKKNCAKCSIEKVPKYYRLLGGE